MSEELNPSQEPIDEFDYDQAPEPQPGHVLNTQFVEYLEDIAMPSGTYSQINDFASRVPNEDFKGDSARRWMDGVKESIKILTYEQDFVGAVEREGADWSKTLQHENGEIGVSEPTRKRTDSVNPEIAASLILEGQRSIVTKSFPLWHSGFWLRLRTPDEGEVVDLYRVIHDQKIELGRQTYGLAFSSNTAYVDEAIVNFILSRCIHSSSLALPAGESYTKYISVFDLPLLKAALISVIYPRGYQYRRYCIVDPLKCTHEEKITADMAYQIHVDRSRFTPWQRSHWWKRAPNSMTPADLKAYQDEFQVRTANTLTYDKTGLQIILAPSNLERYFQESNQWVESLVEAYGNAVVESIERRNGFLYTQSQATAMCQFSHFVERIALKQASVTDREQITETLLPRLSADDDLREMYFKAMKEFKNDSLVAVVGTWTFTCTECKKPQKLAKEGDAFPNIIPIDLNRVFFSLLEGKIPRIRRR